MQENNVMPLFTSCSEAPLSLKDILLVEDTQEILDFKCNITGMLLWPNLRLFFLRTIIADLFYNSSDSLDFSISRNSRKATSSLARAVMHNSRMTIGKSMRADILLNTEAVGDEWNGTTWHNRYVDHFVTAAGVRATVLLDMFEWNWHEPRYNPQSFYHAPIQAISAFRGRQPSVAAKSQASAMVALLERRALDILGWKLCSKRRDYLDATFAAKITAMPFRVSAYRKLLQRTRPKLLLGSSGCYGIHAPLLLAAHEIGVITAEYQHGAISEGHDAYNYAPTIVTSEAYRQHLPQYLLSYGDWWSEHVNVPVEKISIGNPARAEKISRIVKKDSDLQKNILLLSDGVEFDLYVQLAQIIAAALKSSDFRVVIRPHPLERSTVLAKWGSMAGNAYIDANADIYTAFSEAHTVISEVSTGLFEAVGLAERVIIIGSNKSRFSFPKSPFVVANSAQDILSIIQGSKTVDQQISENRIWEPNWRDKFIKFLHEKAEINAE